MSDASHSSYEQIAERLLDAFDRSWRQGMTPPSINSFIADAREQGVDGEGLLRELILIDLEYRWKLPDRAKTHPLGSAPGDRPSAQDYVALYPSLKDFHTLSSEVQRYREKFDANQVPATKTSSWRSEHVATEVKPIADRRAVEPPQHSNNAPTNNAPTSPTGFHPADPRLRLGQFNPLTASEILKQRYRRIELIGQGAFGEVWRAEDTALQRTVAIKSLLASEKSAEAVARMLYEAQAAAAVNHPHLVTVFDVIQDDHGLHLVMEWAPGKPFDEWIKTNPAHEQMMASLADVADALQAVHLAGLIHCDLKPANILVVADGYVKLTDFGLAVREYNQRQLSGKLFGTPLYLSPEQVRGENHRLDGRADIWALGVILYRILTHRYPFQGQTQNELFDEIEFRAAKPPRQIEAHVSEDLEAICLKCLRKKPEDRFATAADLAQALRRTLQNNNPRSATANTHSTSSQSTIPQPAQRMVGRDEITEEVVRILTQTTDRLVTLTGPGGMGKTRLATALSTRLSEHFDHHVHWVELADVRDAGGVCRAVRAALGLPAPKGEESATLIADALQLREASLLVLDNCEQAVEPIAKLVSKWLSSVRTLSILATSQAILGVGGERRISLEPLEYPSEAATIFERSRPIQNYAAIELFLARATQAGYRWNESSTDWDAIAEICRRLEGLPLAIELAAARLPLLGVPGILNKLRHSFDILKSSRRDLPSRQQTLEAAVSWSVSLLNPLERKVLKLLAMLPASMPIDLVEGVIEAIFPEAISGLEIVQELEERSLVRRRDAQETIWIDLLSSVRRHALTLSDTIPQQAAIDVALKHIDYWKRHSLPPDSERRDAVAANLWQASQTCIRAQHFDAAATAGKMVDDLTADHASASLRVERLIELLRNLGNTTLEPARLAELLICLGHAQRDFGDGTQAYTSATKALQLLEPQHVCATAAHTLLADVHFDAAEYAKAREAAETSLAEYTSRDDHSGGARCLGLLGRIAWRTGNLEQAHRHFEAALERAERVANPALRSEIIRDQGNVLLLHGQPEAALEKFLRAEKLAVQASDRRAVRQAIVSHAAALAELGKYAQADELYAEAERLSRLLGDRRGLAMVLNNRGLAFVDQGMMEPALQALEAAEVLYRQVGHHAGSTICLAAQGAAYLCGEQPSQALNLLERALHQLTSVAGSLHEAVIHIDRAAALQRLGDLFSAEQDLLIAQATLERLHATQSPEGFLCAAQFALLRHDAAWKTRALEIARALKISSEHPRQRLRDTYQKLHVG